MKRFENIIIKLIVIQFILLIVVQILSMNSTIAPYLTRMIDYEGVTNNTYTKVLETFNHK